MKKTAIWLNIAVGILYICIGFFDLLAPHFFATNGRVVNSSMIYNFAGGITFLCVGIVFYFAFQPDKATPHGLQSKT